MGGVGVGQAVEHLIHTIAGQRQQRPQALILGFGPCQASAQIGPLGVEGIEVLGQPLNAGGEVIQIFQHVVIVNQIVAVSEVLPS